MELKLTFGFKINICSLGIQQQIGNHIMSGITTIFANLIHMRMKNHGTDAPIKMCTDLMKQIAFIQFQMNIHSEITTVIRHHLNLQPDTMATPDEL